MRVKNRVKKSQDFQRIIHEGLTRKNSYYVISGTINRLGYPRIGISVSKKRGHAVHRNLIRRQIRAICQDNISLMNNLDLVIVVRKDYDSKMFPEMQNQLIKLVSVLERSIHGEEKPQKIS